MSKQTAWVLDTSALPAYLHGEPGAESVAKALEQPSSMSVVNWAETLSWFANQGHDPLTISQSLKGKGLVGGLIKIIPLTEEDAVNIAKLRPLTKIYGLSLGDRACLSLAIRLQIPVLTADRIWGNIDLGVTVRFLR
jgi:PIN domain nuclease of toxin-antitoxin system